MKRNKGNYYENEEESRNEIRKEHEEELRTWVRTFGEITEMNKTIKGIKQENEEQYKTWVRNTKGMNKTIRKISNKLK